MSKVAVLTPLLISLPKWWQTLKTSWSKFMAYRLNFFLQIIGPALIFFFIKYNLWSSIYNGDEELVLKGYNFQEMINYHVWTLLVSLLGQGYSANNLSEDIRMGRISSYLIYPFNFWEFHTASFLAFQILQTLVAIFTLLFVGVSGIVTFPTVGSILAGFLTCYFLSFFWFILQFLTGILGFWLEETWILRVTLQMITVFLSGAIIPLELYPEAFVKVLDYTPFPYLTYYPVKIFMGELQHIPQALATVLVWGFIVTGINVWAWRKGIRLYTAAGM